MISLAQLAAVVCTVQYVAWHALLWSLLGFFSVVTGSQDNKRWGVCQSPNVLKNKSKEIKIKSFFFQS